MTLDSIEYSFKQRVCDQVALAPEGRDRYRVFTPFQFDDGDHLSIVLKRENGGYILSDEGNTFMRLTYDIDEKDLLKGNRKKIIDNSLYAFSVVDRDGELFIPVISDQFGDALFSFIQALLRISDISYLKREIVRSTFMEDFRAYLEERIPADRRKFDWNEPKFDPDAKYAVDLRVNGMSKPLFVFGLLNEGKVKDANINLHQYERWGLSFRSLGIYEDQESISAKVVARFTDVCDKQFSSLSGNKDRIEKFLLEQLEGR